MEGNGHTNSWAVYLRVYKIFTPGENLSSAYAWSLTDHYSQQCNCKLPNSYCSGHMHECLTLLQALLAVWSARKYIHSTGNVVYTVLVNFKTEIHTSKTCISCLGALLSSYCSSEGDAAKKANRASPHTPLLLLY